MTLEQAIEVMEPFVGEEGTLKIAYQNVERILAFTKNGTTRTLDRKAIDKTLFLVKRVLIEQATLAETLPDEQLEELRAACLAADED